MSRHVLAGNRNEVARKRRAIIRDCAVRGMPVAEIAPIAGVSPSRVHAVLRSLGATSPRYELARRRRHNIRVYVRRGLSSKQIAPLVGLPPDSVNRIRRQMGIPSTNLTQFPRWNPSKDPRVGEMTRLRKRGLVDREIADKLGVSMWTVQYWRRRLDYDRGPWNKMASTLGALDRREWRTAREIAANIGCSRPAVHQRLARLLDKGWVTRRWVGRITEWRRTEKGTRALREVR